MQAQQPQSRQTRRKPLAGERKRRTRKARLRWGRVLILLILLLSSLSVLGWGAYKGFEWAQAYWLSHTSTVAPTVTSGSVTPPPDTIQKHETKSFPSSTPGKPMYILVAGVDHENHNSLAAIYLIAVKREEGQIDVIGIPGNSKIVGRDQKVSMLRNIYAEKGFPVAHAAVEDIFHIEIPFFVMYKEGAFQKAMEQFGPVQLYVEGNFQRYNESGADISLVQGYQTLDPQKAWSYITYVGSNESGLEQVQRQERFFQAIGIKLHDTSWPWLMWDTYRFWGQVESNISTWDAVNFARYAAGLPINRITYYILPGTPEVDTTQHITYWDINPVEAQQLLGITMTTDGGTNDK